MRNLILGFVAALTVNLTFGQQTEKLDYCNCENKIDQITPVLNGQFEQKCNGIIVEKGEFNNGEKNGEWLTYSRKGKLIRKINYNNGILHGKVELYFLNGSPKLNGEFVNGNKVGKWIYYTEKGKIKLEGSYENNRPTGIWTINDKKGKKIVVQYDFNTNKYLTNIATSFFKDGEIVQNENTEEWYILKSPNLKYSSKTEPLGGYNFANHIFIQMTEIPENYWDTYLYQKYKISYNITPENISKFDLQLFTGKLPDNNIEMTFLIITNPESKLKKIKHSELETKLLELKIKEALNFLPPWIYGGISEVDVYLHYVINQNLPIR